MSTSRTGLTGHLSHPRHPSDSQTRINGVYSSDGGKDGDMEVQESRRGVYRKQKKKEKGNQRGRVEWSWLRTLWVTL